MHETCQWKLKRLPHPQAVLVKFVQLAKSYNIRWHRIVLLRTNGRYETVELTNMRGYYLAKTHHLNFTLFSDAG